MVGSSFVLLEGALKARGMHQAVTLAHCCASWSKDDAALGKEENLEQQDAMAMAVTYKLA